MVSLSFISRRRKQNQWQALWFLISALSEKDRRGTRLVETASKFGAVLLFRRIAVDDILFFDGVRQ